MNVIEGQNFLTICDFYYHFRVDYRMNFKISFFDYFLTIHFLLLTVVIIIYQFPFEYLYDYFRFVSTIKINYKLHCFDLYNLKLFFGDSLNVGYYQLFFSLII